MEVTGNGLVVKKIDVVSDNLIPAYGFRINGNSNQVLSNSADLIETFDAVAFSIQGDANRVTDNDVLRSRGQSFLVSGNNNILEKNLAGSAIFGQGFLIGGTGNQLSKNQVMRRDQAMLIQGDLNQIRKNIVGPNTDGIIIEGDMNLIEKNQVHDHTFNRLTISGNDNYVVKNQVTDADENGLQVGSNNNRMEKNQVTGPSPPPFFANMADFSVNCGTNIWTKNTFEASLAADLPNPECIQ